MRFVALPQCSSLHGWSAYLLEDGDRARFVWRDPTRGELGEAWLTLGEMDSALRAFHAELDASLEKPHSVVPRSGERMKSDAAIEAPPSVRARGR